jgi:hypothetical protein
MEELSKEVAAASEILAIARGFAQAAADEAQELAAELAAEFGDSEHLSSLVLARAYAQVASQHLGRAVVLSRGVGPRLRLVKGDA